MARFLTTKGSLSEIENVIRNAEQKVVLITPFVQLSNSFQRRLKEAADRNVEIAVICRCDDLKEEWRVFFTSLSNCSLYDEPRLHAKCFLNEKGLVLTSLNLYDFSEQNHEMGIWLDPAEDALAYQEAVGEAVSIRQHAKMIEPKRANGNHRTKRRGSTKIQANGHGENYKSSQGKKTSEGHCIRCGTPIDYDPSKPYCYEHYKVWAAWEDPDYGDDHCHSCGKRNQKEYTMRKPECRSCYRKNAGALI